MPLRRVVVSTPSGLHARPAGLFTQAAAATGFAITVGRDTDSLVDGTSILSVMSLGISEGEEIVIACDDPAAEDALDALVEVVTTSDE